MLIAIFMFYTIITIFPICLILFFYIKKFDNFVLLFKEFKYIHNTISIS